MSQAEVLYRLQELDLGIIRTQKRLAEITAALADDRVVAEAQSRLAAAQQALVPLRTRARNLELEIQANTEKAQATEEQLYSGRVRNPKELQDMQQEIQALKKRNAGLEDRLLEDMIRIEEAEAAVEEAEAHLAEVTRAWEEEHKALLAEQAELQAHLEALRRQREEVLRLVAPESLKLYESLRAKKNNQPVATLNGQSCTLCGVEQTVTIVSAVRRGQELVTCLSCGRILVHIASQV